MKQRFKLMLGDNIESLKKLPDNSIDSVVVDPPYGLGKERDMNIILKDWIEKGYSEIDGKGFMGKEWDAYVPQPIFWKEIFRVLKPGGHILAFFGTRTYDIGTMAIRLAGFEIRDQIQWIYGSGFPKSHNIGKAVDKLNGLEIPKNTMRIVNSVGIDNYDGSGSGRRYDNVNYEAQNEWQGWGTALKPANEPICVARKPLSEKSVAENVLKWGTGGINVDGCRVGSDDNLIRLNKKNPFSTDMFNKPEDRFIDNISGSTEGRFPANIILECICDEVIKGDKGEIKSNTREAGNSFNNYDDKKGKVISRIENYGDKGDTHTNPNCPCRLLDEQSGDSKSRSKYPEPDISSMSMTYYDGKEDEKGVVKGLKKEQTKEGFADKGGASRFFYQAKVSKAERNMGLDGFDSVVGDVNNISGKRLKCRVCDKWYIASDNCKCETPDWIEPSTKNSHPTVKPINLMAYLCRLITPEGGIVLDPFMGSGSTGVAAQLEGFRFVGMEMDSDYFKIAEARIESYEKYNKFIK